MNETELRELVLAQGAKCAQIVRQGQIELSRAFRNICEQNSCGFYGRCWTCPPDAGDIQELMERVRSFPAGVLYQSVGKLEDSFDIEGMGDAAREHAMLSQRIQDALPEQMRLRSLHLSCGGCHLCSRCSKLDDKPCRFPGKAMLSMEACGIDVYRTAKNAGIPYCNGQNTVTYFGIVLISREEENNTR